MVLRDPGSVSYVEAAVTAGVRAYAWCDMLRFFEMVAVLAAALFAGAALYINVAEHPARLTLEMRAAAAQWAPSYKRATWMQAPLALIGLVSSAAAWFMGGGIGWLVGAALIGAVVAFTVFGIMPTNHRLLDPARDRGTGDDTRGLLERWGRLHAVRTGLSLIATALFVWMLGRS